MHLNTPRALALCMVLLAATSAFAQFDTGTINGRVTDSTGAVLVGAQVTVTNTETNFENATTTNAEGMYLVQSLRPGPYRVTIVAAGFKRLVRENISLRVNDTMAVDADLTIGDVAESIAVTGAPALLETQTSATGQVLEGDYFYSLPLYQRWVKAVVFVTPGLTYAGPGYAGGLYGFHLNGQSPSNIGYFEDGMLATQGNGYSVDSISNTVEEVKVLTSTLPAEYGHSAGGAITVVKKGGTNELHGLVSEYGRTRIMAERKYFDFERISQPEPGAPNGLGYIFTQPDANISGPVYIPKLYNGKNKTFFMFGYQKLIEKQTKLSIVSVPTPAMEGGNLSFGGIGQPIFDPRSFRQDASGNWQSTPFPGNIIPMSDFSSVAKALLAQNPWDAPNMPGSVTTNGPSGNYAASFANFCDFPTYSFRLDQQFTPNLKIFGTSTWGTQWCKNDSATIVQNPMFDPNKATYLNVQGVTSVGMTWVLSPTLVSEARLGYYRQWTGYNSPYYMSIANTLAAANVPNIPAGMYISPIQGLGSVAPSISVNENVNFKEDLTKISGRHAFKMGYDYLDRRQNSHGANNATGTFNYSTANGLLSNGTASPNTGNSFAGFLLGSVTSASFSQPNPSWLPRSAVHSFYFQDDWKLLPNLTLNLGMRYSNEDPMTTKYGQISIWNPTLPDDVYTGPGCPATGCVGGFTHPKGAFYNRDNDNFQPRFGLAWHPLSRLVWRGGFALSTIDLGDWYSDLSEYALATNQQQLVGNPMPIYQIDQGPSPIIYPARRPDGSVPFSGDNFSGRSAEIVPTNLHNPYSLNWNAGLQYELSKSYLLELTYAGSSTVGGVDSMQWNTLPWGYLANDPAARTAWIPVAQYSRPWPNWGTISYVGNIDHSDYNSGTVKMEKRYSYGLNFLAFYTFSKCISGGTYNRYIESSLTKGRCYFDQNHVFTGTMTYELPFGQHRKFMNRGGWMNTAFGGFNFVWTYTISSGYPLNVGITGAPTVTYPSWMQSWGNVILLKTPSLRNGWQDLGGDRFTQANQNSTIDCGTATSVGNDCFTYIPSYGMGNDGTRIFDSQRVIAANMSVSKEIQIRERLRFLFRFDYQNPFKWYNWTAPNTTLDLNNPKLFGTIGLYEGTTATYGGQPLMNITLAFKW